MTIFLAGIVSPDIPCNYSSSSSIATTDLLYIDGDLVIADYITKDDLQAGFDYEPNRYSIFDDDEEEEIDLDSWIYKPTKEWSKTDTINWLMWAGSELGHSYGRMSPDLAMPGKKLLRLLKEDFIIRDQYFGARLYDFLHEERHSKSLLSSSDTLEAICNNAPSFESGSDSSDEESDDDLDPKEKARSQRPRLWEFIRSLLFNPKYCPEWIRWENYEEKTFRFVQSTKVARLWGERNKKKNMTYGKFTRAMRYYYTKEGTGIFVPFPERLVYKFGAKATGLETDNPNFESNHERINAPRNLTASSESLYD